MAERVDPHADSGKTRLRQASIPNFNDLLPDMRSEHSTGTESGTLIEESLQGSGGRNTNPPSAEAASNGRNTKDCEENPSVADLKGLEEQLSGTHLNELDLTDLQTEGFPDIASERSATESKTGYPASGQLSSLISSIAPPNQLWLHHELGDYENLDSILGPGADKSGVVAPRKTVRQYCVDLRGKEAGVHTFSFVNLSCSPGQEVKTEASKHFQCSEDEVCEMSYQTRRPVSVLIVGASADKRHLLISYKEHIGCLLTNPETTLAFALSLCQQWLDKHGVQPSAKICLLQNSMKLDTSEVFQSLGKFEELELVRPDTQTLRFLLRLSQRSEKILYVECSDTDYVSEAKERFLQTYREEGRYEDCTSLHTSQIWLTCGEKVLPNDCLLRNVWSLRGDDLASTLDSHPNSGATGGDTFHVHVQPSDAVLVRLNFRSDARKYFKSESVVLISPQASAHDLRQEISKVIHKDPLSFKMFISGKKIEMNTDLFLFLTSVNCTVVVEQRAKIQLTVESWSSVSPGSRIPLALHRYEHVKKLKQEVCTRLDLPRYCVDLQHNDQPLNESVDLRSSRIRDGDEIQALVLPHRTRVSIRIGSSRWEDVVIDDVTVSTVRQLKAYAQAVLISGRCPQSDSDPDQCGSVNFKAFFNGQLLEDDATLRESGVGMNSRILLMKVENLCYTGAHFGRVPVFVFGYPEDNSVMYVMAMCDGKRFYFTNPLDASTDAPCVYQSSPAKPTGIGPCTPPLLHQFPPPQPKPRLAQTSPNQDPYICHMCKSESMPGLTTNLPPASSMKRSHSESWDLFSGHDSVSATHPRHSTPTSSDWVGGGGDRKAEESVDVCDGQAGDRSDALSAKPDRGLSGSVMSTPNRFHHPEASASTSTSTTVIPPNGNDRRYGGGGEGTTCGQQNQNHNNSIVDQHDRAATGAMPPSTALPPDQAALKARFNNTFPHSQSSSRTRHHSDYHSESETSGKASYNFQHSVEQDRDGRITSTTQYSQTVSSEMIHAGFFLPTGFPPTAPQLALTETDQSRGVHHFPIQDTTFTYIQKETIHHVSKSLGYEAPSVMMQLLPYPTYTEIDKRHGNETFTKNFECLVKWLQMYGKQASVNQLKKVLVDNGRQGLADEVDHIEAKASGYETAP